MEIKKLDWENKNQTWRRSSQNSEKYGEVDGKGKKNERVDGVAPTRVRNCVGVPFRFKKTIENSSWRYPIPSRTYLAYLKEIFFFFSPTKYLWRFKFELFWESLMINNAIRSAYFWFWCFRNHSLRLKSKWGLVGLEKEIGGGADLVIWYRTPKELVAGGLRGRGEMKHKRSRLKRKGQVCGFVPRWVPENRWEGHSFLAGP